jgi:hypothetical protein
MIHFKSAFYVLIARSPITNQMRWKTQNEHRNITRKLRGIRASAITFTFSFTCASDDSEFIIL